MSYLGTVASDRERIPADLSLHGAVPSSARPLVTGSKVTIEAITKQFGDRVVLRRVGFEVAPGEFLAIVGHSGSGKSTLLRLIAGLDRPTSGRVLIDDQPLTELNRTARMMFQEARLLPWLRVGDNVALGLDGKHLDRVPQVLSQVGLADRAADWPTILSGGQRQRVALARALACEPELLLLDEPLGSLDALTRIEMQNLIADLWLARGSTAVLVTHDIEEAVLLANHIFILEDGEISLKLRVDLPRPRIRTQESFQEIVRFVLAKILRQS